MSCFCLKNKKGLPEGSKCCFKVFWVFVFFFFPGNAPCRGHTLLAGRAPRPPPGVPTEEGWRPPARSLTTHQSAGLAPSWDEGRFRVRFGYFKAPGAFIFLFHVLILVFSQLLRRALAASVQPPSPWHPTVRRQNGAGEEDTCLSFCGSGWRCGGISRAAQLLTEDQVLSGTEITALPLLWPAEMRFLGRDPLKVHSGQLCRILA